MDLFGHAPVIASKPKKARPPSLPEITGVDWPYQSCRNRPGNDPRLLDLRQALDRARTGNDADALAWVLTVALSWLGRADLDRVSDLVAELIGSKLT